MNDWLILIFFAVEDLYENTLINCFHRKGMITINTAEIDVTLIKYFVGGQQDKRTDIISSPTNYTERSP
jgi:hypothetical protein